MPDTPHDDVTVEEARKLANDLARGWAPDKTDQRVLQDGVSALRSLAAQVERLTAERDRLKGILEDCDHA